MENFLQWAIQCLKGEEMDYEKELIKIGEDRISGASTIARNAARLFSAYIKEYRGSSLQGDLLRLGKHLIGIRPDMAPLIRLVNDMLVAEGAQEKIEALQIPPFQIDPSHLALFSNGDTIATVSTSSSVALLLKAVQERRKDVQIVEEGAWHNAGKAIVGADAIYLDCFVNAKGTEQLAKMGIPFYVVAENWKVVPLPAEEIFEKNLFTKVPLHFVTAFLMEGGAYAPEEIVYKPLHHKNLL